MPKDIHFQWDRPILSMFHQELCLHHDPHHEIIMQNRCVYVDCWMLRSMGDHKTEVSRCTDLNYTQMGHGVSCPHRCIKASSWAYVGSKSYRKMWSTNCICPKFLNNAEKNYTTIEREALSPWFLFCINSDTIYLETNLFSMLTTWHCYIL